MNSNDPPIRKRSKVATDLSDESTVHLLIATGAVMGGSLLLPVDISQPARLEGRMVHEEHFQDSFQGPGGSGPRVHGLDLQLGRDDLHRASTPD